MIKDDGRSKVRLAIPTARIKVNGITRDSKREKDEF